MPRLTHTCRSQNHGTLFSGWRSKQCHCYDQVQSGTLLMNLHTRLGNQMHGLFIRIFQKSSNLLRLNLILNDLSTTRHRIRKRKYEPTKKTQRQKNGRLQQFDYIQELTRLLDFGL
jgi:hypothetical protein